MDRTNQWKYFFLPDPRASLQASVVPWIQPKMVFNTHWILGHTAGDMGMETTEDETHKYLFCF